MSENEKKRGYVPHWYIQIKVDKNVLVRKGKIINKIVDDITTT